MMPTFLDYFIIKKASITPGHFKMSSYAFDFVTKIWILYHYFFPSVKKVTKKSSLTNLFLNFTFHFLDNLNSHKPFVLLSHICFIENFRFHKMLSFCSNSRLSLTSVPLKFYGKPSYGGGNDRKLPAFFQAI